MVSQLNPKSVACLFAWVGGAEVPYITAMYDRERHRASTLPCTEPMDKNLPSTSVAQLGFVIPDTANFLLCSRGLLYRPQSKIIKASAVVCLLTHVDDPEPSVRRSCLKTILSHLKDRAPTSPLTSTQCLQLWRGLYVALYMHDSKNAISVQNLAAELASTVEIMAAKDEETPRNSDEGISSWLSTWADAFWETICREWVSIDQWRMNKVLLLVRFFLRETFKISLVAVATDDSDTKTRSKNLVSRQSQILEKWPLSPRERKVPDGLRLHVLDVWADELLGQFDVVHKQFESETIEATLRELAGTLMLPVETISKEALSKGVKLRAKDAIQLFAERFPA